MSTFSKLLLMPSARAKLARREFLRILPKPIGEIACVAFSQDGKQLASGGLSVYVQETQSEIPGQLTLWNMDTGSVRDLVGNKGGIWSLTVSQGGNNLLATAGFGYNVDGELLVWDMNAGKLAHDLKVSCNKLLGVAISSDGKLLASVGGNYYAIPGEVKVWNPETGTHLFDLTGQLDMVNCVAFSPDGKRLAAGTSGSSQRPPQVLVWDLASKKVLFDIRGLTKSGLVTGVAFSPDGKHLASCGGTIVIGAPHPGEVKLWDMANGHLAHDLVGHSDIVRSVAFSPDGSMLASGSEDRTVRLWFTSNGSQSCHYLQRDAGRVSSVAYSPDARWLASGGHRSLFVPVLNFEEIGEVWLWNLKP